MKANIAPTLGALADCVREVRPGVHAFEIPESGEVREWIDDWGKDNPLVLDILADAIRWARLRAGRPIIMEAV